MAQTDKDKNTFLSKLARFVANPTTDWSALDKASQGQKGNAPGGEGLELTHEEIFALRHQRRKDNRNIRIKEFAILRQIRAGASVPGAPGANSDPVGGAAAPALFPAPQLAHAAAPAQSTNIAADFRVSEIGRIEEQMAGQWWGAKGKTSAPTEAQKTQMLIETIIGEGNLESESQEGDLIAFDPAFLAQPPVQPPQQAEQPVAKAQHTEQQPVAPLHGSGEQVDFSQQQKADQQAATFVYRAAFDELPENSRDASVAAGALPPWELRLQPLTQADAQSMAAAQAMQEALYADNELQPAVVPPEYTPEDLPECLNEPAIRFAQGDHARTETQLLELAQAEQAGAQAGLAAEEPHVSLALLDFYRCTEQEEKFEAASIQMVRHFDRSAPQYQGADLGEATLILSTLGTFPAEIDYSLQNGWRCPPELDLTDVMLLRSQLVTFPAQVLLDWRALQAILDDAVEPLLDQFRDLAKRKVDLLMWGGEHLLACCARRIDALNGTNSPVYPLLWLLRLELVRIMHGQEGFDYLALEYCMALEESPPSWVRTRCHFIDAENALSMLERGEKENAASQDVAGGALSKDEEESLKHPLQWKGTLKGDIRHLLQAVSEASTGDFCIIDCSQLNSIDYPAAVTLLEWLMAPQNEQRHVQFVQVNRLLAVFWRIMGITAQATVKLRRD